MKKDKLFINAIETSEKSAELKLQCILKENKKRKSREYLEDEEEDVGDEVVDGGDVHGGGPKESKGKGQDRPSKQVKKAKAHGSMDSFLINHSKSIVSPPRQANAKKNSSILQEVSTD